MLNFKGFAGILACLSVVGTAIGSVVDSHINKDRMAQADGEAARKNLSKNV